MPKITNVSLERKTKNVSPAYSQHQPECFVTSSYHNEDAGMTLLRNTHYNRKRGRARKWVEQHNIMYGSGQSVLKESYQSIEVNNRQRGNVLAAPLALQMGFGASYSSICIPAITLI